MIKLICTFNIKAVKKDFPPIPFTFCNIYNLFDEQYMRVHTCYKFNRKQGSELFTSKHKIVDLAFKIFYS